MTFRARLVLAATGAVVVAILAASLASYFAARNSLIGSVDSSLSQTAHSSRIESSESNGLLQVQVVDNTGNVLTNTNLPIDAAVRHVASGTGGSYYTNVVVNGVKLREYVYPLSSQASINGFPLVNGGALQLATPLTAVDSQLSHLGWVLTVVAVCGIALALALGWLVGRTALVPLYDLTASIENIADTTDVSRRLDAGGADELGRLRRAFNRLLAALDRSREAQRQLVLDAGHELRTPLTSLRTNLEVVRRLEELPPQEREILVDDVLTQMEELTTLVGDISELARGDQRHQERVDLRLDALVEDAVAVAATHGRHRDIHFELEADPTWIRGQRDRVARAVGNLLDNAVKWSPEGGTVEVTVRHGTVAVRDHGPGIAQDDLPHVFDRFYRSPAARALPGSGLGLAIVAQVAEAEGGSVSAGDAVGGGALLRLSFPPVAWPVPTGHGVHPEEA